MTTAKGGQPALVWDDDMLAVLIDMRQHAVPLYECAERIGVGYGSAVLKARELGIAHRFNCGAVPGRVMLSRRSPQ